MLYTQEVFLVLELDAGEVTSFTSLQWGPQSVTVSGEWQDGTRIHRSLITIPERTAVVEVTVTQDETRGQVVGR